MQAEALATELVLAVWAMGIIEELSSKVLPRILAVNGGMGPSLAGLSAYARCAGMPMRVGGRVWTQCKDCTCPRRRPRPFLGAADDGERGSWESPMFTGIEGTGTSHVGLVHFCLLVYTILRICQEPLPCPNTLLWCGKLDHHGNMFKKHFWRRSA